MFNMCDDKAGVENHLLYKGHIKSDKPKTVRHVSNEHASVRFERRFSKREQARLLFNRLA